MSTVSPNNQQNPISTEITDTHEIDLTLHTVGNIGLITNFVHLIHIAITNIGF